MAFRVRGCFVYPCCWLALGVNRAAREVVAFVQIVGPRLALVVIRKKLTKIQQEDATYLSE